VRRRCARALVTASLLAAALLAGALPGAAQEEPGDVRVGLTYRPGYLPALALPAAEASAEALGPVASRVDSILQRDLHFSDRFDILELADTLDRSSGVRYGLWNELGAVWLVTAHVSGTPESPLLRVALHDVVYGRLSDVRAYSLPAPGERGFRMAVHRASDGVVRWATGQPGMAASRIAFRRKRADGTSDLWMVDSDGHGLRRVTSDSSIVYSPAFSPDASRLLYVSYRGGAAGVYEKDLRSGSVRPISTVAGVNLTPAYGPDGEHAYVARTITVEGRERGTEVVRMQLDPLCCVERVTSTDPGDALNPSVSPEGGRIAFEATPLGEQQIYVAPADGGPPALISRYVYGERGSAAAPDWSPAGDRIAYQAWVDGRFQVATVNPDGSDRRILTSEGSNEEPSWAPDGRHLVFRSTREGYHALWVLDTVTGSLRRLVANHVDQTPDWSPSIGGDDAP